MGALTLASVPREDRDVAAGKAERYTCMRVQNQISPEGRHVR